MITHAIKILNLDQSFKELLNRMPVFGTLILNGKKAL
jgi:hypothetical protein